MKPIYLLALCRKTGDKGSKLTRIAKCSFSGDAVQNGDKIGEWWLISIIDDPLPSMVDLVFIRSGVDPAVRAANAVTQRLVSGLSMASGVKWYCDCGPIDEEDAALLWIEMEVLSGEENR